MIVREDAMLLFGFANTEERDFFDLLRGVSGVGPKLAQAVLSQLSPGEIAVAVAAEDDKAFAKVSGVGPKTAKLLVVTLAGRLKAQIQTSSGKGDATATDVRDSVVQALTGLGIPEKSAADVVDEALVKQPDASRESVLRDALATLGAAKGKR
jgi:Holliday junction DNA helicase RuvA